MGAVGTAIDGETETVTPRATETVTPRATETGSVSPPASPFRSRSGSCCRSGRSRSPARRPRSRRSPAPPGPSAASSGEASLSTCRSPNILRPARSHHASALPCARPVHVPATMVCPALAGRNRTEHPTPRDNGTLPAALWQLEVRPKTQPDLWAPCTPPPALPPAVLSHALEGAPCALRRRHRIWGTWDPNLSARFPAAPLVQWTAECGMP